MTESGSTSDSPSLSGDESPPPLGTVAMSAEGARHALRQTRSRPSTADAIALGVAVPHRYEESRFGRFGRGMWSTGARRKRSGRAPAAYARSVTASALLLPGAAPPTHHRLARSRSLSRKEPSAPLLPGGCAPYPSPSGSLALAQPEGAFGSLGRPRTRSATMFRWIWLVPPQIVSEREKKNDDIIGLTG